MSRINKFLIFLNIIIFVLIIFKLINQKCNYKYEISDNDISLDEIRNELYNDLKLGASKYTKIEDGKKINISEKIKEEQILTDGLKIENYKIESIDGYTTISADIINISSEEKGGYYANFITYNELNQKGVVLKVYVNKIAPNSKSKLNTSISADITDIYRCELEKIEEDAQNE